MPKNVILTGPFGTGKTFLIVELFKMKVARYKSLRNKHLKIIIATYLVRPQLVMDFKAKYNLHYIIDEWRRDHQWILQPKGENLQTEAEGRGLLEEYEIVPKSMKDLSEGELKKILLFEILLGL